jgi:hypothetical protein
MTKLLTIPVALLALGLLACGGGGGGGGGGDPDPGDTSDGGGGGVSGGGTPVAYQYVENALLRVTITIVDPLDTVARPVPWPTGVGMPVILSVENISQSDVTFSILRDPWHDVTAVNTSDGSAVWQMVPSGVPGATQRTIAPGVRLDYNGTWPCNDPAGTYALDVSFVSNDPVLPTGLSIPVQLQ